MGLKQFLKYYSKFLTDAIIRICERSIEVFLLSISLVNVNKWLTLAKEILYRKPYFLSNVK